MARSVTAIMPLLGISFILGFFIEYSLEIIGYIFVICNGVLVGLKRNLYLLCILSEMVGIKCSENDQSLQSAAQKQTFDSFFTMKQPRSYWEGWRVFSLKERFSSQHLKKIFLLICHHPFTFNAIVFAFIGLPFLRISRSAR